MMDVADADAKSEAEEDGRVGEMEDAEAAAEL